MNTALDTASEVLLSRRGLSPHHLQRTLGQLASRSIDQADIFLEASRSESWSLEDGIVKGGSFHIDQGAGVRAVSGEKTGFAYSNEIAVPALLDAAKAARAIAVQGGAEVGQAIQSQTATPERYVPSDPLQSISVEQKVGLLATIDRIARQRDPRVQQVMVGLSGQLRTVMVADLDGLLAADIRPLTRLNVTVVVEEKGRIERGSAGGGGRFGYEYFQSEDVHSAYVDLALEEALTNLRAEEAPAGNMPVVLGPGWPGILLHEAIGHGLEGDFNRKQTSAFCNRLGERIASAQVTVVDDGSLANRRGSLNMDDEGTPSSRTVLVEDGILKGYMQDKLNARLMGTQSTGNGRRQSYAYLPMPRMTNTFMLAGQYSPDEIVASVKKGIYARSFGGGQVDITNGKFVFNASLAWMIEDGKLSYPVKGATLTGNGPDVLTRVSMVGRDMQLDSGVGVCGKDGQSVPVGVGQPTLRIDELVVGGTRR